MTPDQDGRLHELLSEAVADVEPRDRLGAIRSRTDARRSPRGADRPWTLVLSGALAVACVIAAVAGLGQVVGDRAGPTALPSAPTGPTGALSMPPGEAEPRPTPGAATTTALPIYYLVDTERAGVRLVREFRSGDPAQRLDDALRLLEGEPLDPDYRTAWPPGSFAGSAFDGVGRDGSFSVVLSDATLLERPAGLSAQEAEQAVQQVVWTLQGVGQTRAPVRFHLGREPVGQVLGVPTEPEVTNGSSLQVLNLLNITTPEQGQSVTEKLRFTGVANSFEASVYWEIRQGTEVVASGPATAGWQGDRLHPFEEEIDVSGLEPGDYTIWATTDDPTGGTEGAGAMTDSKEFTIP